MNDDIERRRMITQESIDNSRPSMRLTHLPASDETLVAMTAAAKTLRRMGYTYTEGADLWRPPLGQAPAFDEQTWSGAQGEHSPGAGKL